MAQPRDSKLAGLERISNKIAQVVAAEYRLEILSPLQNKEEVIALNLDELKGCWEDMEKNCKERWDSLEEKDYFDMVKEGLTNYQYLVLYSMNIQILKDIHALFPNRTKECIKNVINKAYVKERLQLRDLFNKRNQITVENE